MLTARQREILKIVIEEFISTAEAVGSVNISDKYDIDASPATIRNEMARLSDLGMLMKEHASAGRTPTTDAMRWFLEEVIEEFTEIDPVKAATARESLFQKRFSIDNLLQEAVRALTQLTNNTSLAVLNNRRYTAGISQFVDQPEYQDLKRLKKILLLMEDYKMWSNMFSEYELDNVKVLIGEETGIDQFSNSAVVFAPIKVHGNQRGYISVIGPNRMDYRRVIPAVKYIVGSIKDAVEGW
jgi:heat-inducible transcriptional repressor